jgi:hypothetical protein
MSTGRKCKSPAVNGQLFCYNHFVTRRHAGDGLEVRNEPLLLPSLEDIGGIQIALMQITNALGSGRITNKQAGLYLYSLQIASTLAARADKQISVNDPVRSLSSDNWGNIIAEEVTVCEPPHDCLNCTRRNTCEKFEDYEEEVEELEQQLAAQQEEQKEEEDQAEQEEQESEEKEESEGEGESEGEKESEGEEEEEGEGEDPDDVPDKDAQERELQRILADALKKRPQRTNVEPENSYRLQGAGHRP